MPDTTIKGILDTYCTIAVIPEIEDAKDFEGNSGGAEGVVVMAFSRGLTYRLEQADHSAPGGGQYKQRGAQSGDVFTITIYAMSDGTDTAEHILQDMISDFIKAVSTFNAAGLTTYDYTHVQLPNLKDITVNGEKDYKTAVLSILGGKNTKENY